MGSETKSNFPSDVLLKVASNGLSMLNQPYSLRSSNSFWGKLIPKPVFGELYVCRAHEPPDRDHVATRVFYA